MNADETDITMLLDRIKRGGGAGVPVPGRPHTRAEADKNYRSLVRSTTLTTTTEAASTLVSVPALNPWGILVVEKLP